MKRGGYSREHLMGPTHTECRHCGVRFAYRRYGSGRSRHFDRSQEFCSRECAAEFQVKGWGTDKHGYQVSYRSNGEGRRVWRMQHRDVMEQHLGRKLRSDETVHHKNGDRADNRLENLELWSSRHGRGQRVEDKIAFCKAFLADYAIDAPLFSQSDAVRGMAAL